MNEQQGFEEMLRLAEEDVSLRNWPETLRLCILRLRWLGIDTTKPIHRADFGMVWEAVYKPEVANDPVWRAEAEAGKVCAPIAYFDALSKGWTECVECWNRNEYSPERYADVEAEMWELVDLYNAEAGAPTFALWETAWRNARGEAPTTRRTA